jgi:hypothetical protein
MAESFQRFNLLPRTGFQHSLQAVFISVARHQQRKLRRPYSNVRSLAARRGANIQHALLRLGIQDVRDQLRSLVLKINLSLTRQPAQAPARALYSPGIRGDDRL